MTSGSGGTRPAVTGGTFKDLAKAGRYLRSQPGLLALYLSSLLMTVLTAIVTPFLPRQGIQVLVFGVLALVALVFSGVLSYRIIGRARAAFPDSDDEQLVELPEEHSATTVSRDVGAALATAHACVMRALDVPNTTFVEEVTQNVNRFLTRAREWGEGRLETPPERYNELLLRVYEGATRSVFSTSIPDYLDAWTTDLGRQIIGAHERSKADDITRVFVFDRPEQVTEAAREVIRSQMKSPRLKVLIFFAEANRKSVSFPPDVSRDFTIIDDGDAVAITVSYGQGNYRARWFFRDRGRAAQLRDLRRGIEHASVPAASVVTL